MDEQKKRKVIYIYVCLLNVCNIYNDDNKKKPKKKLFTLHR